MNRKDDEPPQAIAEWGWRFHHLGVPTTIPQTDEAFLEPFQVHVAGFETSPYGIQWMRFAPDSPVHPLIQRLPHLAFEVDDLEKALKGKEILTPPNAPSPGVRVAMIVHNGCPVELIQFAAKETAAVRSGRDAD